VRALPPASSQRCSPLTSSDEGPGLAAVHAAAGPSRRGARGLLVSMRFMYAERGKEVSTRSRPRTRACSPWVQGRASSTWLSTTSARCPRRHRSWTTSTPALDFERNGSSTRPSRCLYIRTVQTTNSRAPSRCRRRHLAGRRAIRRTMALVADRETMLGAINGQRARKGAMASVSGQGPKRPCVWRSRPGLGRNSEADELAEVKERFSAKPKRQGA